MAKTARVWPLGTSWTSLTQNGCHCTSFKKNCVPIHELHGFIRKSDIYYFTNAQYWLIHKYHIYNFTFIMMICSCRYFFITWGIFSTKRGGQNVLNQNYHQTNVNKIFQIYIVNILKQFNCHFFCMQLYDSIIQSLKYNIVNTSCTFFNYHIRSGTRGLKSRYVIVFHKIRGFNSQKIRVLITMFIIIILYWNIFIA